MTFAISSQLESLVDSPTAILPWEEVDSLGKHRLESAIRDNHFPHYLISPPTPESLSQVVQWGYENEWTMLPCGNSSKLSWGGLVTSPKLAISTQRLNRIIDHAVGDLTVTVEAGVKLADLQQTLRQVNQFLPIEPTYPQEATLGGIMATADAGSWRQRYGGIRDLVLGLSFVRCDGKIAKGGGRVVKNVAGYDLMKLFTGSYGTLGIISEITFRLYPYPEASGTIGLTGDKTAIATATQILQQSGLQPTSAEIISASMVQQLEIGEGMGLIVRFQSIPSSVKEQLAQVEAIAQKLALKTAFYQEEIETHLWQQLRFVIAEPGRVSRPWECRSVPNTKTSLTSKIGVRPNTAVDFLAYLDELTQKKGLGMINIGSGVGHLQLETEQNLGQVKQLRAIAQNYQGFLTILEAPKAFKKQIELWGYTGNTLSLMGKIKQQFDPKNLLSPGRFF